MGLFCLYSPLSDACSIPLSGLLSQIFLQALPFSFHLRSSICLSLVSSKPVLITLA